MRIAALFAVTVVSIATVSTSAFSEDSPVESVLKGCKTEIKTHCGNVTMGRGRILACLYAYQDKLSGACEYALYDAAVQLERAVSALSYVVNECAADLREYCASVRAGQGRLLACFDKNKSQISDRCKRAVKDVGLQ